jgi:3-isopropylmalate/(R)-2-methylmalate dehydratase small subunit
MAGDAMQPFSVLTAIAVPLTIHKIDTGMILPGRYMRQHRRPGHDYAAAFLHDVRFDENENPRADCPLNQDAYRGATILVAGSDFGCGSSREGAAYAVLDYGFKAMIAPSFGDIFYGNCLQNGILPVVLPDAVVQGIWRQLDKAPGVQMTIDLPAQEVAAPDGSHYGFEIEPVRKERLLRGLDDIDVTLQHQGMIEEFETSRANRFPWLPKATNI